MKAFLVVLLFFTTPLFAKDFQVIETDEIVMKLDLQALGFSESFKLQQTDLQSIMMGDEAQSRTELLTQMNGFAFISTTASVPFDSLQLLNELKTSNGVVWAYRNKEYIGDFHESVDDPSFTTQTYLNHINAPLAWSYLTESSSGYPIVAVTDDGFDLTHEDLVGTFFKNEEEIPDNGVDDDENGFIDDVMGWNFNQGNNDPSSNYRHGTHGTHVSGIIGAQTNNSVGVAAVFPGVKVLPIKFFGEDRWTSRKVFESYAYALKMGAKIINTSYMIDYMATDSIYLEALKLVEDNEGMVFNSAGNNNTKNPTRSRLENILLVTAISTDAAKDKKVSFSNHGFQMDVAAPGQNIFNTTKKGRYGKLSGTSMASPVAAASAAFIWYLNPEYTRDQVVHHMKLASVDISFRNESFKNSLGSGRVDLEKIQMDVIPLLDYKVEKLEDKKQLRIHFNGLPKFQNTGSVQLLNNWTLLENIEFPENASYGTNQLTIDLGNSLADQILIHKSDILDPFGREMKRDILIDL
ncbi:MAG: S8 family serine peptidase [Bdellovibrionales bacterium]